MRLVFVLCALFVVSSSPVLAASAKSDSEAKISSMHYEAWQKSVDEYGRQYNALLKRMVSGAESDRLDEKVPMLRSYYSKTMHYNPFSKHILDKLTEHAWVISESRDAKAVNDAVVAYHELLNKHLVNFGVLSFALTMSNIDVRYGDEIFYRNVMNSLIKSFAKSRRGGTPERAYHIVSYGEENHILEGIGGRITASEVYVVGRKYYNVHDIMSEDGEYKQVFMDVSDPIKNMLYKKRAAKIRGVQDISGR